MKRINQGDAKSMNLVSKIVAVWTVWIGVAFAAPAIWDGSADVSWYESSAQNYNLTTAEQLAGLAKLVNEGTSDFSGKTITLGADIFLNDTAGAGAGTWASIARRSWTPIGTSANPFKGEFDGLAGKKNRRIYGLYYNDATSYVGLFGYTNGVTISNIDLLVGRVTADNSVGALVGYALSGTITNVHSEIKVTGKNRVGGLVGYCSGGISRSSVKENVVGQDSVGGLVGFISGNISGTEKANSSFVGNVNGRMYVGGLAGRSGTISYSYVEGRVEGDSSYVGGLAGYGAGVSQSYVNGPVKGKSNYVGGLAGYATSSISKSYHEGDVSSSRNYVGGLAGRSASISESYAKGSVEGDSSYVGGLAGYASSVSQSYVNGPVKGKLNYVGGLVGFATSSVTDSHYEGDVSTLGNYVGGLIGASFSSYSGTSVYTYEVVKNSYSVANVQGANYVGGVIGLDSIYKNSSGSTLVRRNILKASSQGKIEGKNYVGGVVGRMNRAGSTSYIHSKIDSSWHTDGIVNGMGYVGGVAGSIYDTLSHSYSKGSVTGDGSYIGGLVGSGASILQSYVEGAVAGKSSYVGGVAGSAGMVDSSYHIKGNVEGAGYVGGLVGKATSMVSASYSEGDVSGTGSYVGGLLGYTTYAVSSSYSKGNVTGSGSYVGGLVGSGNLISKSYAEGIVSGNAAYVGGLAGYAGSVSQSYANGPVTGKTNYVGGLIGYATSSVTDSHYEGDVSTLGNYVGGLVGISFTSFSGTSAQTYVVVKNSYSVANVQGEDYVGGVIGLDSIYRSSSGSKYVRRNILKASSQGKVVGNNYVGGVVGRMNRAGSSTSYIRSIIDSCWHTDGVVSGLGYVGGVAGSIYDTLSHSYSRGNVTGGGSYVGGIVGNGTSLSYSYSKGDVTGSGYVGGLIGYGTSILQSYAEGSIAGQKDYVGGVAGYAGKVDSSYHVKGNVEGAAYVGGLVGKETSTVTVSYSEGDVSGSGNYVGGLLGLTSYAVKNSYSKGNVTGGGYYVGGLIGSGSSISQSYAEGSVAGKKDYVGGVAGSAGKVDTCYHTGGNIEGAGYVGGLAGNGGSTVTASYSEGDVSGTGSYVGGLLGNTSSAVINSHSKGNVTGSVRYIGGLVGRGSSISQSFTEGSVKGEANYVGGLAGYASSAITESHFVGNVSGLDSVGGLAGYAGKNRNSYAKADYVKGRNVVGGLVGLGVDSIDVSYFIGDSVTGIYQVGGLAGYAKSAVDSSYSTANVKGDDNVGGLVGSAYGDVSNSYAIGNVDGDENNSSAGNDNLGGLVGYQYGGSISKSMALGNISGTTKLGGLVGRFDGTSISQSYANGNVTGHYYGDPADEVGNYYIGGLVGFAKGAVEETYSSGVVKGMDEDPVYTGCMVGYVNGSLTVKKSYYDKSKCNLGIDGGVGSVSLTGNPDKTTAEMKTLSTFEDWDFVDTWKMLKDSYPYLQIYSNSFVNAVVTTESLEGFAYDGTAKTPLVTSVTLFGETLAYETEYTIAYENNVNAGVASINICGVKPYSGCKIVDFEIAGIAVQPSIATIADVVYTGEALTPEVSVYNGESLLPASDYTVEYANNINVGTASVFVKMKGNYSGKASTIFQIKKATPVIVQNPKANDVIFGETLASSILSGGKANVEGEFVWKTPSLKPSLQNDGYAVVFVPTDARNYTTSAEIVIPVKVLDMVYVAVHANGLTIDSTVVEKGTSYVLPKASVITGYDFVGFYKGTSLIGKAGDVVEITENTDIDAVYQVQKYIVTFMNGNVQLQSGEVSYGEMPKYTGDAPTKTASAKYTYSFKSWTPAITAVTSAATYTALFDSTLRSYDITFKNGSTVLQSSSVSYGTKPSYSGSTPTKASTAQYTYKFKSWNPTIATVTGAATYTALFDSTLRTYTITFKNGTKTLQTSTVSYGSKPSYSGSTPTKSSTTQYTYTFKSWDPTFATVTGAATYTALFDSTLRTYSITFKNGTTTLQTGYVAYGAEPSYAGDTPTKTSSARYTYTFKAWSPTITAVTGTRTYTALFDSTLREYEIIFKNGTDVLQSGNVAYGTKPSYAGSTPTKEPTAQYAYTFKSWSPTIATVTEAATYTALFDSTLHKYAIIFKNGTDVLQSSNVAYGTKPSYAGSTPTKESTAQYVYTFKSWNPTITAVTEDAVYTALFDSTLREYTITFKNGSDTLQVSEEAYGTKIGYKGSEPTKKSTEKYVYTFKGWDPALFAVIEPVTYTAVFDSTLRTYSVTFKNGTTTLQSDDVAYGEKPNYMGDVPTKNSSGQYSYTFKGWSPSIVAVSENVTYTAVFDSSVVTGLAENGLNKSGFIVSSLGRTIQISSATVGEKYVVLDMQGRELKNGVCDASNFNITMPVAGNYLVKVGGKTKIARMK